MTLPALVSPLTPYHPDSIGTKACDSDNLPHACC